MSPRRSDEAEQELSRKGIKVGEAMRRAIVTGSGVAGLSAAVALRLAGWSVQVFEQSPAIREIGAGIFIKDNGLRVLESYGLLERLARDCVVLEEARVLDSEGQLLQRRILKAVNRVWNIKRQNLVQALRDRAVELGAEINLGAPVEDYDPDGTITVGSATHKADLVVAADGVGSMARTKLGLANAVRQPKSGAIRLLVPRTEFERHNMTREFWSSGLRIGVAPCTEAEVYSYMAAPHADQRGGRAPVDAAYWSDHFPQLAREGFFDRACVARGVHHPYPMVSVKAWSRGRVALVGDAVHALPPTLGQGAGLSLMNTCLLAQYVSEKADVGQALQHWEKDWRWVSNQTQAWALRYDRMTSEWPRIAYPLRSAIIWGIGKSRAVNNHMRIADRIDAPGRRVLESADFRPSHAAA
jgi:2-polyprenyl-6-methoxyphenol hydroxylase-like FAD-dependent oxidoreductase